MFGWCSFFVIFPGCFLTWWWTLTFHLNICAFSCVFISLSFLVQHLHTVLVNLWTRQANKQRCSCLCCFFHNIFPAELARHWSGRFLQHPLPVALCGATRLRWNGRNRRLEISLVLMLKNHVFSIWTTSFVVFTILFFMIHNLSCYLIRILFDKKIIHPLVKPWGWLKLEEHCGDL